MAPHDCQESDATAEASARCALFATLREDMVVEPDSLSLERLIGCGRTAEVYKGTALIGECCKEVAVKEFYGISLSTLAQEWQDARGKGTEHDATPCDNTAYQDHDTSAVAPSLTPLARRRLERRRNRTITPTSDSGKRLNSRRFSASTTCSSEHEELLPSGSFTRRRSGGTTDEHAEGIVLFAREFCVMEGLKHEHILELQGIFLGDPLRNRPISLVTEFCAGGSFWDLLHNSSVILSWAQRREALLHAARGMEYLHMRDPPVMHRDLKPQNMLLKHEVHGPEDKILLKVADFGLCRTLGIESHTEKLTVDVGTLCYMAPEVGQEQGGEYNLQADIYSFAVVMYETLARQPPYEYVNNPGELRVQVAAGLRPDEDADFRPEEECAPDGICPRDLPLLMRSCWTGDPSSRPTATQIRQHLERGSYPCDLLCSN